MANNGYWKHNTSGDIYAVQVSNGEVVSACGPLHHSEAIEENLHPWNFNNEPELVPYLNEQHEQFGAYPLLVPQDMSFLDE